MSLPVSGAALHTTRASVRRAEIARCRPGDPLALRRERGRRGDPAVAVISERGIEIGGIDGPHVRMIAGQVAVARAVFQSPDTFGAVIRVAFDGSAPTLPQPRRRERIDPPREPVDQYCEIFPCR